MSDKPIGNLTRRRKKKVVSPEYIPPPVRFSEDTPPYTPRGPSEAPSEPISGAMLWEEVRRQFAPGSDLWDNGLKQQQAPLQHPANDSFTRRNAVPPASRSPGNANLQNNLPSGGESFCGMPESTMFSVAQRAELEWVIQLALMKATVCVTCVAVLCVLGWQLFLPVLSPILFAAGFSVVTHPQHHANSNARFVAHHQACLERAALSAPGHPVLAWVYHILVKFVLSFMVWGVVPEWLASFSGLSLLVRNIIDLWMASPFITPTPRGVKRRTTSGLATQRDTAEFSRGTALGVIIIGVLCSCPSFRFSVSLHLCAGISVVVAILLMMSLGPEKSASSVKVMATVSIVWVLFIHVAGGVIVETLEIVEYAQHRVQAAGSMVNEAVESNNATELLYTYAAAGIEQLAESHNVSLEALRGVMDVYMNGTVQAHESGVLLDYSKLQNLHEAFDYSILSSLGANFWMDLSKAFGSTTRAVSTLAVLVVSSAADIVSALVWGGWSVVLFVAFFMAFNHLPHTLPFYLLARVVQRQVAVKVEREIAHHLTALTHCLVRVFVFHFTLTFATLTRFGSTCPYIGAVLAGFFALFPYLPKYFLVPLPVLLGFVQVLVSTENPEVSQETQMRLYELLLWIVAPMAVGDDWIFAEIVEGNVGPKMVVLSFLMGFYNFGVVGVILGPVVVSLFGSLASSTTGVRPATGVTPTRVTEHYR